MMVILVSLRFNYSYPANVFTQQHSMSLHICYRCDQYKYVYVLIRLIASNHSQRHWLQLIAIGFFLETCGVLYLDNFGDTSFVGFMHV